MDVDNRAGHAPETLKAGVHSLGFPRDTTEQAADDFFPGYAHMFTSIGNEVLGGIDRITFRMTSLMLPHAKMLHAIDLGTRIAPLVRKALAAPAAA